MDQGKNNIDLRRLWRAIKQCKWLYLAAIILFTGLGIYVSFRRLPQYEIQGSMLIGESSYESDNRGGGIQQMMKTFSVGGFSASTVDNEVLIMQSHDVMLRTVRTLGLNRIYTGKDKDGKKAMLYKNTPVRVEAPAEYFDTLATGFNIKIRLLDNNKADITATKGFFRSKLAEASNVSLPYLFKTPLGILNIMPVDSLIGSTPFREISVNVTGNNITANTLYEQSTIAVATKLSDIINVDYDCANAELGKATVNAIMNEYNAKRLERLHESAAASIKYYDERIAETFKILRSAENDIAEYQKKNKLMGVDSEVPLLVENSVGNQQAIQTANYNIAYYETVLDILRKRLDDNVLIPQMESLNDPNIGAFNSLIEARRELRRSATEDNEALQLLNEKIETLRNLIIENSTKMIAKAKADVKHQQNIALSAMGRLNEYPDYQIEYMNLMRDNEYQNRLYQYLISQRENSVLQLYSSSNIGFIYQDAYVVKKSGILKKLIIPFVLFLFALFACTCFAVFLMLITRKVKDPMDLAFIGIECHTVKYTGNKEEINRLRTMITADPAHRVVYFASLGDTGYLSEKFAESLLSIGRSIETISGFDSNDSVLQPSVQQQIVNALPTTDYVIVNVPDPEKVCDIENLVDNDNSILILGIPENKITRKAVRNILKGQTVGKVFAIISASK